MLKWIQNFGKEILFQQWEKPWMKDIKFTAYQALRENRKIFFK